MVGYQVDGPLWVVFGLSRGLCGRSSYDFGAPVGCLGPLSGPMLAVLGRPRGLWAVLGCLRGYVGGLGPLLRPLWAILGRSWGLCSRSWAVLGPMLAILGRLGSTLQRYVGGLGPLLGPMLGVLAALWASVGGPGLPWVEKMRRTWLPCKCAYFSNGSAICGLGVGLEPLLGPMLAVLGRSWALCWRSWAALWAYVGGLGAYVGGLDASWGLSGRSWA